MNWTWFCLLCNEEGTVQANNSGEAFSQGEEAHKAAKPGCDSHVTVASEEFLRKYPKSS